METSTFFATAPASTPDRAALTVYFDGACPVCSREIASYRRQVGAQHCAWVDASACPESALGIGLSRKDAMERFHVRRADGHLVDGIRAFALLWQVLPRLAWVGRLASFGPLPALLDGAYAVFLRLRPLWRALVPTAPGVSASSKYTPVDSRGTACENTAQRRTS
jgi:predicted DCC family thiol-disulfide oxidoreductase YuxK